MQPDRVCEKLREIACYNINSLPITYKPDDPLRRFAWIERLGAPLTPILKPLTIDGVTYEMQGFAMGIVYCMLGDYDNIKKLEW